MSETTPKCPVCGVALPADGHRAFTVAGFKAITCPQVERDKFYFLNEQEKWEQSK